MAPTSALRVSDCDAWGVAAHVAALAKLEHPDEDEAREILDEALEGQDDPQLQRLMEIFFRRDSVPEGLRVIPLNVQMVCASKPYRAGSQRRVDSLGRAAG